MWRVGRHRLAWRPARQPGMHPYRLFRDPFRQRDDEAVELVSWLAAALATIVVLPWRAEQPVAGGRLPARTDGRARPSSTQPAPAPRGGRRTGAHLGRLHRAARRASDAIGD